MTDSLFVGNSKTSTDRVHLPIWRNKAALLSIYGNLIYATERTRFGTKMAAFFNDLKDLKDEESSVRWTGKLPARFRASLNNNQNKRHCSKVNLVTNWESLPLKPAVNHEQQDILSFEYYRGAFKKKSHCKTCAAFLLVLGIFSIK